MLRSIGNGVLRTVVGGTVTVAVVEWTTKLPSEGRSSELYHRLSDKVVLPLARSYLDPEQAHEWAIRLSKANWCSMFRPNAAEQQISMSVTLSSSVGGSSDGDNIESSATTSATPSHRTTITFPNIVGLAAGFDKDAVIPKQMLELGFGFVEVGSVTPLPQPGTSKDTGPRMFRLMEDKAVINRYGFNSAGADQVEENLRDFRTGKPERKAILEDDTKLETDEQSVPMRILSGTIDTTAAAFTMIWKRLFPNRRSIPSAIVGVNLGKNKISEGPDATVADYVKGINQLGSYADYLVVNVSSPNTPGLRDVQTAISELKTLLTTCLKTRDKLGLDGQPQVPLLFVKISPDLTEKEMDRIAQVVLETGVDGLIVSNTTLERSINLQSKTANESGGLSGAPLRERSTECIRHMYQATRGRVPIIGVGGISKAEHVMEKVKAGASLVQIYTSLVFEGPGLVSHIRRELAELVQQQGFKSMEDVIGYDHPDLYWKRLERQQAQLDAAKDETERQRRSQEHFLYDK